MIGICGVAMGTLAGMLKQKGFSVSGSDENVYPPMSDMLKNWGINIHSGFNAENIGNPDLVIIGNAISRGNPEAEHVLNLKVPYASMAQALYDFFLKEKEIISISGTHGKTTTTALLSHILITAGEDPSFLIGGVSKNYNTNFGIGRGRYFVIEGDEYDSAFFEKIPKFILYRPHHLILTSLEFDHADIYKNIDEIALWFRRLVNIIPSNGNIVYSGEYSLLKEISSKSLSKRYTFGKSGSDFNYELINCSEKSCIIKIRSGGFGDIILESGIFGDFNFQNITSAVSMALLLGIKVKDIQLAIQSFAGVRRRQELIFDNGMIKIYEDFAHHPTAIRGVIDEIRKIHPDSVIWAIYEPRSATSRRNVLQDELVNSFGHADKIIIKKPYRLDAIPASERIDIESIAKIITSKGLDIITTDSTEEIINCVVESIDSSNRNIIIIMSNGGFDGIYEKMINAIKNC